MPSKNELALCDILESFEDISDELSFVLESFEFVRSDIETAIDDLYDELESIREQVDSCTRNYVLLKKKMLPRLPKDSQHAI